MSVIDQKEYLKKYLSIGKAPGEKKKKKKKKVTNRVQIIDDDAEANLVTTIIEDDPLQVNEDAPQIVAIIDERPPSMRTDDKTNNPLWRPIGRANDDEEEPKPIIAEFKVAPKSIEKQYEHLFNEPPPKKSKRHDPVVKKKMEKTLDGKSAGLQNAKELAEETKQFRTREDQVFKSLPQEVSGESAETVHRDRKTGKIRNLQEEEEQHKKKNEEEEKQKEKYSRWGRGLAQVESRDQQIQEELHEMSKPLARYADDEDLEKYLKEQEREGDPMLAYLRSKRRKKDAKSGKLEKPKFEGEFMPNRYGVRPGHRWDGVDRSNGYEKKWFEVQNEKKALQEESYKWSTEDM